MKIIIAGSRNYTDYKKLIESIQVSKALAGFNITAVISGRCEFGEHTFTTKEGIKVYGADGLGEKWAGDNNIPVEPFKAEWKKLGKKAGPLRNKEMAKVADGLIAFLSPNSKGTESMIQFMKDLNKPVFIIHISI